MNSQELRALQEAYMSVYAPQELDEAEGSYGQTPKATAAYGALANRRRNTPASEYPKRGAKKVAVQSAERHMSRSENPDAGNRGKQSTKPHWTSDSRKGMTPKDRNWRRGADEYGHSGYDGEGGGGSLPKGKKLERQRKTGVSAESFDLYDIILSHLLDEGFADTQEAAEAIMVNMSEDWRQDIMEKEDSEYEKASDAALDKRYGYGRASGDKRSFGRAANRSSAAAALRAIRRGERSGSGTSREAGSDAVHQGWAKTAKTSADQTPEKKARRAQLANTSYSNLPDDEKEKDRVSFDAVRATYNKNKK